jgi:glycosyltransferase involved in cell wall biosynthesis
MKIIYPYNEVLPLKKAHDAYIVRTCASLAQAGHEVTLLIGIGSLSKKELFDFYGIDCNNPLEIDFLPILRRNNFLKLQWNPLFFWMAQRRIQKQKPNCVICSVLKQADFHLSRKVEGVLYLYEVHQLQWYPTLTSNIKDKKIERERSIFNRCDQITVTTNALKTILTHYPYEIEPPIEKIPLACDFRPLKAKIERKGALEIYYVGQLYESQGLKRLLLALKEVKNIHVNIIGGKWEQIEKLRELSKTLGVLEKVSFKGFFSTKELSEVLSQADLFITTFDPVERMPYVAHTKLYEYQAWQRPIIAPNFQVVREHVPKGSLLYDPEKEDSLVQALKEIQDPRLYQNLYEEIKSLPLFTWEKRGCLFNKLLNNIQRTHK